MTRQRQGDLAKIIALVQSTPPPNIKGWAEFNAEKATLVSITTEADRITLIGAKFHGHMLAEVDLIDTLDGQTVRTRVLSPGEFTGILTAQGPRLTGAGLEPDEFFIDGVKSVYR